MSELKAYIVYTPREGVVEGLWKSYSIRIEGAEVYLKSEVATVLDAKDTEIARLKACMANMVNTSNMVNDSAMRRERKLKRALWSMGAMLGKMGSLAYWNIKAKLSAMSDTEGVDWASRKHVQWKNVERKCRQRADWFK